MYKNAEFEVHHCCYYLRVLDEKNIKYSVTKTKGYGHISADNIPGNKQLE